VNGATLLERQIKPRCESSRRAIAYRRLHAIL
jgi:hypothetical protein